MFSKTDKRRSGPNPPSLVSYDMRVLGDVVSEGDVQVEGAVHGDVKAGILTVGAHAVVKGSVICDEAMILGEVDGEIFARKVTLAKSASVRGDIVHEAISIDAGAYLDGRCKRLEPGEFKLESFLDGAAASRVETA